MTYQYVTNYPGTEFNYIGATCESEEAAYSYANQINEAHVKMGLEPMTGAASSIENSYNPIVSENYEIPDWNY